MSNLNFEAEKSTVFVAAVTCLIFPNLVETLVTSSSDTDVVVSIVVGVVLDLLGL